MYSLRKTFSSVIGKNSNVKILSQIDNILSNQTRKVSTEDREDEVGAPQGNLEKTINQVTLLGRVGSDPQKKGTMEHPAVVFSLATHVNYKYESGEQVQKTDWHRIVVFKPSLRDLVYTYMRKGQRVHISGKLSYGSVTEGTVTKPTASVIADDIIFFYSV